MEIIISEMRRQYARYYFVCEMNIIFFDLKIIQLLVRNRCHSDNSL